MKLLVNCKDCQAGIKLKYPVLDRAELARTMGDTIRLSCPQCGSKRTYGVNGVVARESKSISVLALALLLLGTGLIAYLLLSFLFVSSNPYFALLVGGLILVPSIVYVLLKKQERERVSRFNRYRVGV